MIEGIDHTAISVPDIEAAVDFYCNTLGFEVVSESSWARGSKSIDALVGLVDSASRVVMVRLGDSRIELFEYTSPAPRARDPETRVCDHGITHVCLVVRGIEAEVERLRDAGVRFESDPIDVGTSLAVYGRDPFGNVLELKQPKAETPADPPR